ncbi:MAG: phosphoribosyltransferase family protein [Acidobacteriota bacterium]|nr:phosphoribosyltransferase family protein [Acidobacteriota bacterium]
MFAPARTQQRWRGRGARGGALQGACVVLVDDVATTGATLEGARVLRGCGVAEVRALTLARVVHRESH